MPEDFTAPLSSDERERQESDDAQFETIALSYDAYSTACYVGDRMQKMIAESDDISEIEAAEQSLRDAHAMIEERLAELRSRKVALTTVPLVAA